MAGSSTQSMENFTAQGMERHQMMMNTEVMKHLRIMNRASVREIMLQHEKTFKEQVHDLHKLYEVQRLLMDKAKSRGRDAYVGVPPPSPGRGTAVSEEINQGQRTNFWEQATPDGIGMVKGGTSTLTMGSPPKAIPERIIRMEEMPKITSSPVRKRKIDLEQLPEDDSDDEMENSSNTLNATTSSLSGNSKELPKVYSGFEALAKAGPGPHGVSGIQPLPPVKHSQVGSFLSGESSSHNAQIDGSRGEYHGKAAPSLPMNVMKPEQSFTNFGERNLTFQNAGVGSIKNNTMFLPQPDLIDRASQETGRQASWFFQAPEANMGNTSARFLGHQQQRQSPHLTLPEHSTSRSHHPPPNLEQHHITNNSPSIESVGSIIGKASLERLSPGIPTGAHPKDASAASVERLGDTSKWFTKESFPQANVVPMARFDARVTTEGGHGMPGVTTEGGHGMPGVVTPAITLASSKGLSQDRDVSLWSSQNPILQLPQYQQPPVFQQQVLPPSSQPMWVQSSQNAQNSIYPQQQMVFGLHTSDPSQIGYRGEPLQRNQGDIVGPWNMIGLGHYYSSVASTPQKPPFKKPPKLVLKNDGVGMELKLVTPEKEMIEKERAIQKKPFNVSKRDSLQSSSKPCENISGVQKEVGEEDLKLGKRTTPEVQIPGATREAKTVGTPVEPKLLATASSSSALTLSQGASNSVMVPSVAQRNLGALACMSGSLTGSGFTVSVSPNQSILQQGVSQLETVCPSSEPEKMAELRTSSLKSSWVTSEKEALSNAGTRDMQGQMEGGGPKGEIDVNLGLGALQERKEPLDKMLISEGNMIDVVATSQSETFNTTPQGVQLKSNPEGGIAADLMQQRAQKLEEDKGSLSQRVANAEGHQNDFSESKTSCIADSIRPSSQPVLQAVSSASTDAPSTSRQEKKRPSKLSSNDLSQRVSGKITTAYKSNESGSSVSDRDCASAPSLNATMSESKSEAIAGVLNEDLQHDSDSDNLAASILLSFAPKLDPMNEEKQSKESASEISSSSMCKVRPPGQVSKTFRSPEARMGLKSDTWNAGGSQGRRMQNNPVSSRRMDRTDLRRDYQDPSKVMLKERHRREEMNSTDRPTDEGDVVTKSLTIKLPRVATSTSNGEAIPISRSKQLSKLNGLTFSGNPVKSIKNSHKGNEAVHTPTGRRSSRGPPMGARAPPENRSRLHQQTQHRVECSPPPSEKDSGIREEGGRSINKLEVDMKSKAWGELNRTRSHPRKHFPEVSHRKSQK